MPPDNGGYMLAAYLVTAGILTGYAGWLWRRVVKAGRVTSEKVKGEGGA